MARARRLPRAALAVALSAALAALPGPGPGPGAGPAHAQAAATLPGGEEAGPASLVADRIRVEGGTRLVAEGAVEVYYAGARLSASRVVYDQEADTLEIEGPILLTEGGTSFVLADSAALDATLRRGILRGARLVLDRRLQIAAAELARSGGRYTRLSRAVASSCEVCEGDAAPLWEIRARRVVRDEIERQLYFDEAQLRFLGLPVFYLPSLRLPDPTLRRARGFLVPRIVTRSGLGTGIKAPWFLPLGPHADLTFTPYLSSSTTTLEARFRQELSRGRLSFEGALSRDDLRPDATRAYLFGEGLFRLPRDFALSFDLRLVSDPAYLLDYRYSEADRLESGIRVDRIRDDQVIGAALTSVRTLRASEIPVRDQLPNRIAEFDLSQRIAEDPLWGSVWASVGLKALERPSSLATDGRDVARLSAALDWDATTTLGPGLVARGEARLAFDHYLVSQDPTFPRNITRIAPAAAVTLSWPLERQDTEGVRHLLEPTVQLAWADLSGGPVPNEDSTVVEFDEANLFSLSRFPGTDAVEEGLRANFGVTWTRYDPTGWSLGATVGRVFRFDAPNQFGAETGLSGTASDWLLAVSFETAANLSLANRTIVEDDLAVVRSETRFAWNGEDTSIAGTYLFRAAEPTENRFEDTAELALDAAYRFGEGWTGTADWRYEADAGRTTRAGLGIGYENECIGVDLSLSRRFTSSTNVAPATEVSFRLVLTGFGTGGEQRPRRQRCGGG